MIRLTVISFVVWLSMIIGGAPQQPQAYTYPDFGSVPIPNGLTAHLENPQLACSSDGTIYAATRPSSSVGGLVWKVPPGGQPQIVLEIDPRKMYALGEFAFDNQGRLMYVTVPDPNPNGGGDNTTIDFYRVPGWTP
jgi:hypothetical protein